MAESVNRGRRKNSRTAETISKPARGGRNYQPRMSQPERKARRKAIAEAVKAGGDWDSVVEAAERYDVSISAVRYACQENKVTVPKPPRKGGES